MLKIGDVLKIEVMPALGCTEPISEALAAAVARRALGGRLKRLKLTVDRDTFKNSFDVGLPGVSWSKGNRFVAALGYVAGRPDRGLEVLEKVSERDERRARRLVERGVVGVCLNRRAKGLYVKVRAETDRGTAEVVIRDHHTRVAVVKVNGKNVREAALSRDYQREECEALRVQGMLERLGLEEMIAMAGALTTREGAFVEKGIEMNLRMARRGLKEKLPLGIGKRMKRVLPGTPAVEAAVLTAAAVEARMSGITIPVMSSGGSGNCGILASIPVAVAARSEGIRDRMLKEKSVALSHLVNAYVKAYIGRRSAICGGAISAATGACAGVIYLLGGRINEISNGINNMMASLACVLCDGARPGCALKLAHGARLAVETGFLVARGGLPSAPGGLIGRTAEETIRNIGRVSRREMNAINEIILSAMLTRTT